MSGRDRAGRAPGRPGGGRHHRSEAIEAPPALAAAQARHEGEVGRAFVAALPADAARFLARRRLHRAGPNGTA
ncbi:hypothetical protein [Streptomyces tremellae]|uniref:hypothetical protein n=1 Tax=Streptomyces tremellae TaxID=1124239 RepID=UPI0031F0AA86